MSIHAIKYVWGDRTHGLYGSSLTGPAFTALLSIAERASSPEDHLLKGWCFPGLKDFIFRMKTQKSNVYRALEEVDKSGEAIIVYRKRNNNQRTRAGFICVIGLTEADLRFTLTSLAQNNRNEVFVNPHLTLVDTDTREDCEVTEIPIVEELVESIIDNVKELLNARKWPKSARPAAVNESELAGVNLLASHQRINEAGITLIPERVSRGVPGGYQGDTRAGIEEIPHEPSLEPSSKQSVVDLKTFPQKAEESQPEKKSDPWAGHEADLPFDFHMESPNVDVDEDGNEVEDTTVYDAFCERIKNNTMANTGMGKGYKLNVSNKNKKVIRNIIYKAQGDQHFGTFIEHLFKISRPDISAPDLIAIMINPAPYQAWKQNSTYNPWEVQSPATNTTPEYIKNMFS